MPSKSRFELALAALALVLGSVCPRSARADASLRAADDAYSEIWGPPLVDERLVSRLPASLRGEVFGVALWQYLSVIALFVVGLLLRKTIAFLLLHRLRGLAERTGKVWATKLVDVFASPGATLVMAGVVWVLYPQLGLPAQFALALQVAVRLLVVLSVVWAAYRLVDVVAARMADEAEKTESRLDDQLVPLLRRALKVATVIVGALFALQNLDVNVTSLLAGLGIGGLAFALAAKDTIANFFGSVMIFVDRPFQIGDWIVAAGCEGVVVEVGFRSTRVRTFYDSILTVPNARLMDAVVDNYGARRYRRCKATLSLCYDTSSEQMQAFVEGVRSIIQANPHTRKDAYEVHMSGFGESGLEVLLYYFFDVKTWTEELRERHNVYLETLRLAELLGIRFAFPTRTVHIASQDAVRPQRPTPDELTRIVESFGPGGAQARPSGPELTHGFWPTGVTAKGSASADG